MVSGDKSAAVDGNDNRTNLVPTQFAEDQIAAGPGCATIGPLGQGDTSVSPGEVVTTETVSERSVRNERGWPEIDGRG